MNLSTINKIIFLISILFVLGMQIYKPFNKQNFKQVTVYTINKSNTDLNVDVSLNTNKNTLEFTTVQKITKISLFDFNGKKINTINSNNPISLANLEGSEYYLSFVSDAKFTIKSIYLK